MSISKNEAASVIKELRKYPQSQHYADMTELLFFTGLAFGETQVLTPDKIDFKNKALTVNGTYDWLAKEKPPQKTKRLKK